MAKVFKIISILFLSMSACAQSPDSTHNPVPDYMIIGTYHGECFGTCARFIKVTGDQVFVSSDNDDSFWIEDAIEFEKSPRSNSNNEHINAVVERFPIKLLSEPSRNFGEPDSYDQGGIYIEVKREGVRKIWKIDTDPHEDIPDYLEEYLKFVGQHPL